MNAVLAFILAGLIRVSPYVVRQLRPILIASSERLWKAAYPLAAGIIKDLETGNLAGLDKHKAAVQNLESAIIATGKFDVAEISKLHLGQIILAAYANMALPAARPITLPQLKN